MLFVATSKQIPAFNRLPGKKGDWERDPATFSFSPTLSISPESFWNLPAPKFCKLKGKKKSLPILGLDLSKHRWCSTIKHDQTRNKTIPVNFFAIQTQESLSINWSICHKAWQLHEIYILSCVRNTIMCCTAQCIAWFLVPWISHPTFRLSTIWERIWKPREMPGASSIDSRWF